MLEGESRARLTVEVVSATDPAVEFAARVRHGRIYRTGVFTLVFALATFACSGGGSDFGHPKITVERMGNDMAGWRTNEGLGGWYLGEDEPRDMVGRPMGEGLGGWYFEEAETRDIDILETEYSGNTATIVIHMNTVGAVSGRFAGKLRLHYEWVAFDDWTMVRVENLDFKRQP